MKIIKGKFVFFLIPLTLNWVEDLHLSQSGEGWYFPENEKNFHFFWSTNLIFERCQNFKRPYFDKTISAAVKKPFLCFFKSFYQKNCVLSARALLQN